MILLIDNSNTRTKFAFGDENGLREWQGRIDTEDLSVENIRALLAGKIFCASALCSVVPQAAEIIREALADKPFHQISHLSKLPITISYPQPAQIGADRLANAAAAFSAKKNPTHPAEKTVRPAIVIDFGTAVTFDVIDASGAYCGGAIAPGTAVLRDYLATKTALLPKIELAEPASAIGKSTEEAMLVGSVIGYRGLIRSILEAIQNELGNEPIVMATGGDAELISLGLPEVSRVDSRLTLEGIRQIALLNFPDKKRRASFQSAR